MNSNNSDAVINSADIGVQTNDSDHQPAVAPGANDIREALFNDGAIGRAVDIQKPLELITTLRGILFDIDPALFRPNGPLGTIPTDPANFYRMLVANWFARHPTLSKAEVRISGTGLHGLLRLDSPIEFVDDAERMRWAAMVKVVQATLPIDPKQPGITAITRPAGTVNTKNGATVLQLAAGQPVSQAEILELYELMMKQPFRMLSRILFGGERIRPCPVCRNEAATLAVYDHSGHCYRTCGKVKLQQLLDAVYDPLQLAGEVAP